MEQFSANIGDIEPQLVSLVLLTIVLMAIFVFIYLKVKKSKPTEAPKGTMIIVEQYVGGFEDLFQSITKGNLNGVAPYIFTLFTFLLFGNIMGLIGFPPPASSYSVPLLLGVVAWCGIWVSGLVYKKLHFLKKFLYNPTEVLSQFAPLISISFRLFGNMIAGTALLYLVTHFLGYLWGHIPYIGAVNLLAPLVTPPLRAFFDFFDGVIQAFVFALLTTMYWTLEAPEEEMAKPFDPKAIYVDKNNKTAEVRVKA